MDEVLGSLAYHDPEVRARLHHVPLVVTSQQPPLNGFHPADGGLGILSRNTGKQTWGVGLLHRGVDRPGHRCPHPRGVSRRERTARAPGLLAGGPPRGRGLAAAHPQRDRDTRQHTGRLAHPQRLPGPGTRPADTRLRRGDLQDGPAPGRPRRADTPPEGVRTPGGRRDRRRGTFDTATLASLRELAHAPSPDSGPASQSGVPRAPVTVPISTERAGQPDYQRFLTMLYRGRTIPAGGRWRRCGGWTGCAPGPRTCGTVCSTRSRWPAMC
ncbi:hypothetical protein IHE61_27200 [Streptomyces sp. GKU 257-1]|nr:hypothetical protein [Streptomyces sp. GKU 257-1]